VTFGRWLNLFRGRRLDRELEDQLRHHLEGLEADYRERGLSSEDARRAARRDMGGISQVRDAYRDVRGVPLLETVWRSVRFGARSLRRTAGVTMAVVATLAIGIGATVAIFAVVNGVLLKPLPYPDADRLVAIGHRAPGTDEDIPSAPYLYFAYRDQARLLDGIGLWRSGPSTVTGLDKPEQVQALVITREILPILGVPPLIGREFSERDDSPGRPQTVILTYGYWQRRFGGDPAIVGQRLMIDGQPAEIIGVMPQRFGFLDRPIDLLYPFQLDRSQVTLGRYVFQSLARLKPGVTLGNATADLTRVVPLAIEQFPPPPGYTRAQFARRPMTPRLRPLHAEVVGDIGGTLWVVMAALGMVMVIVCANVGNLLLVRADGRAQELAVRAALGASRARIVGELLVEGLLVALAGGVAGVATAYGVLRIVLAFAPATLPRLEEITIDRWVLLFTLGLAIFSGLFFGLLSAAKHASPRLAASLTAGGRTMSEGRDRRRTRGALVVVQVAIALLLLVCSGLMIRTFAALSRVEPGFTQPRTVQLFHVNASLPDAERTTRTQQALVDRLASIPGVTSVGFADLAPLGRNNTGSDTVLTVEGTTVADGRPRPLRRFEFISPGYFRTLGMPMIAGRDLVWPDLYEHRTVALVSERLAREEWGSPGGAIGRRVRVSPSDPWREIVGVVGNLHDDGMSRPVPPIVYFPALVDHFWGTPEPASFGSVTFAVRSVRAGNEGFIREFQQAVWDVNPTLPVAEIQTLGDVYASALARPSFTLTMLVLAGAMGLLIGFVGVYGVIAYDISLRSREIGIRVALGARAAELERMFVRHGLSLAAVGAAAGAVAALFATRLMSSVLFGVSPLDPWTYGLVTIIVLAVAGSAAYVPARRTARRQAVEALRCG
jgi:predicted permease